MRPVQKSESPTGKPWPRRQRKNALLNNPTQLVSGRRYRARLVSVPPLFLVENPRWFRQCNSAIRELRKQFMPIPGKTMTSTAGDLSMGARLSQGNPAGREALEMSEPRFATRALPLALAFRCAATVARCAATVARCAGTVARFAELSVCGPKIAVRAPRIGVRGVGIAVRGGEPLPVLRIAHRPVRDERWHGLDANLQRGFPRRRASPGGHRSPAF